MLFFRALADTDADGKMDVNEFSIACKLINLKLRGYQVPKGLPPSLLASLKTNTPPAIPPLPNASLINAPPRPDPPKPALIQNQQAYQPQPLPSNLTTLTQVPSAGLNPVMTTMPTVGIPTGIVPPMPTAILPTHQHALVGIGTTQPLVNQVMPTVFGGNIPAISNNILPNLPQGATTAAANSVLPMVPATSMAPAPMVAVPSGGTIMSSTELGSIVSNSGPVSSTGAAMVLASNMSPVKPSVVDLADIGPGATSTPRSSIASLEKAASIESP